MRNEFSQYQSAWWQIDYPSHWIVEKHQECVSFYAKDGIGALQISAYSKDQKITKEDINELINDEVPIDPKLNEINLNEFSGISTEFEDKKCFWRIWVMGKEKLLFYISYNCDIEDSEVEREIINQILHTLK